MKKEIKNLFSKLIIYLSRKNHSKDNIKQYQKKFLYIFLPILIISTFRLSTNIEGAILGIKISANLTFFIINFFIMSIMTLAFYLYIEYFEEIRESYLKTLFKNHKQIICAYSDKNFGDKVYEIKQDYKKYLSSYHNYHEHPYIHTINGDVYNFFDWRAFKFVGIKESRKLKLKHLKSIMNEN